MHSECGWHADEGACEDGDHDDHDNHDDHDDHDDHDNHDDHDDHNVFEITGLSEGFTTFTISIMHGAMQIILQCRLR